MTGWSAHRRGRHGLARTFQHSHAFRGLTVRENVEVSALGVGAPAARRRAGRRSCSSCSASLPTPIARRRTCRTATSEGSASRGRSRPSRASCSWTSPRRACPRRRYRASPRRSAPSATGAPVSCSSTTTSRSCSTSASGSTCSTRGRRSPRAAAGDPRGPRRRGGLPRRERGGRGSHVTALAVEKLSVRYGAVDAVRGLSLEVKPARSSA